MAVTIELDRYGGMVELLHHDESEDRFHIETVSDVEPILDLNKASQNDGTRGYGATREWRLKARIPNVIALKLLTEKGIDVMDKAVWDDGTMDRVLNDPDYRYLRTY